MCSTQKNIIINNGDQRFIKQQENDQKKEPANEDNKLSEQCQKMCLSQSNSKKPKRVQRKKKIFKASNLLTPFQHIIPELIEKPQKSKRKATNIPKFIIKIFYKTQPIFPTIEHNLRLKAFSKQLDSSITRFHLVQLFGLNPEEPNLDNQNQLNRQVLRRLLIRNYDNILSNSHIQHKRIYMLFSKKMLLRLNQPRLVGNIEI